MWKKVILFTLIVLTACNNEEEKTMLTKEESEEIKVQEEPEPVEKEDLEIEFTLEGEILTLNTKNIPILEAYMETVQNKKETIRKMELTRLEPERLYLLSFNCEQTTCSYLLLDRNTPNRSYLIDDFVTVSDIQASPELTKLLIILETDNTDTFQVFDLEDWAPITLKSEGSNRNMVRITDSNWQDEETIELNYLHVLENTENTVVVEVAEKNGTE